MMCGRKLDVIFEDDEIHGESMVWYPSQFGRELGI